MKKSIVLVVTLAGLFAGNAQAVKPTEVVVKNGTWTYKFTIQTSHMKTMNQKAETIGFGESLTLDPVTLNDSITISVFGKPDIAPLVVKRSSTNDTQLTIDVSGGLMGKATISCKTNSKAPCKTVATTTPPAEESPSVVKQFVDSAERELLKLFKAAETATSVYIENVSTKYNVIVNNNTANAILPGHTKQLLCAPGKMITLTATDKKGAVITYKGQTLTQTLIRPENIVAYRVDVGYTHGGIGRLKTIAKCVSTSVSFCIAAFTQDDIDKMHPK